MVGLRKIVTLLATAMVVLCLVGIATPAFAQMYGGKGIPQTSNMGANANMGMSKSMPTANMGGMEKGMPQANVGMGKGMPQANVGGMDKGMPANVGMGKGMPQANMGMGKGIPQAANMGANANMGMGKGMEKGGYGGGYGTDMGMGPQGALGPGGY